ncbi:MAG: hypothetical protein AVDCRST_MAG88-2, partial [uncultured Thermomicrobiales bacterium]
CRHPRPARCRPAAARPRWSPCAPLAAVAPPARPRIARLSDA